MREHIFKIVLIGDSGVGKSNICSRLINDRFSQDKRPTVGVEFITKKLKIHDKQVRLNIYDTAGQERYRSMANAYYRGSAGALLVYDVSNRDSFQNVTKWLTELRQYTPQNIKIILVGNKSDLPRVVTTKDAMNFAEDHDLEFMEISAFTGENVLSVFTQLVEMFYSEGLMENDPLVNERIAPLSLTDEKTNFCCNT